MIRIIFGFIDAIQGKILPSKKTAATYLDGSNKPRGLARAAEEHNDR